MKIKIKFQFFLINIIGLVFFKQSISLLVFFSIELWWFYRIYSFIGLIKKIKLKENDLKKIRTKIQDELSDVAVSYLNQVNQTENLFAQIAEKITIEKEVQTAELSQSLFFPKKPLFHKNLTLTGKVLTATQCSGDWWQYKQFENNLFIGIGDATGHGVSASIMMTAIQSAYFISMKKIEKNRNLEESLGEVFSLLNQGALSVSSGESSMTFLGTIIDLNRGLMMIANASHPLPYVLRKSNTNGKNELLEKFIPIVSSRINPLGYSDELSINIKKFQLIPGDKIFWYTDGLLNGLSKTKLLKLLQKLETNSDSSSFFCDKVLLEYKKHRTISNESEDDDATLIVAEVPSEAIFEYP